MLGWGWKDTSYPFNAYKCVPSGHFPHFSERGFLCASPISTVTTLTIPLISQLVLHWPREPPVCRSWAYNLDSTSCFLLLRSENLWVTYHVIIYCICSFLKLTLVWPPIGPPGTVLSVGENWTCALQVDTNVFWMKLEPSGSMVAKK